jgi:hypothetical protein
VFERAHTAEGFEGMNHDLELVHLGRLKELFLSVGSGFEGMNHDLELVHLGRLKELFLSVGSGFEGMNPYRSCL